MGGKGSRFSNPVTLFPGSELKVDIQPIAVLAVAAFS